MRAGLRRKERDMNIAVVDGQGGGIGRAIVDKVKRAFPDKEPQERMP